MLGKQLELIQSMVGPQPQPDGLPEVQAVPSLSRLPIVDPTDGLIPDVEFGGRLAAAFPNVDPWLIGEPDLPESIVEVEMDPDAAQVMLPDGTWVPLVDVGRGDPAPEEL